MAPHWPWAWTIHTLRHTLVALFPVGIVWEHLVAGTLRITIRANLEPTLRCASLEQRQTGRDTLQVNQSLGIISQPDTSWEVHVCMGGSTTGQCLLSTLTQPSRKRPTAGGAFQYRGRYSPRTALIHQRKSIFDRLAYLLAPLYPSIK